MTLRHQEQNLEDTDYTDLHGLLILCEEAFFITIRVVNASTRFNAKGQTIRPAFDIHRPAHGSETTETVCH